MKIKCLVLDHDDTVVNSTPCIHYPAFLKAMEILRPGMNYSIEAFWTKNFSPGLRSFYTDELGFTEAELRVESDIWRQFTADVIPPFFEGMGELIKRYKAAGGLVCVVSHSLQEFIRRDYDAAGIPQPDLIYGWNEDRSKCKPNPWPLLEIMRITGLEPRDLLMVDDLKPGLDMAHECGVKFAGCSWSYDIPAVSSYMKANADFWLTKVADLEQLLFSGGDF